MMLIKRRKRVSLMASDFDRTGLRYKRFWIWLSVLLGVLGTGLCVGLFLIGGGNEGLPMIGGERVSVFAYWLSLYTGQSKALLKGVPGEVLTGYWVMVVAHWLGGFWTLFYLWGFRDRRWGYWLLVLILSGLCVRFLGGAFVYWGFDMVGFVLMGFWFLFCVFVLGLWLIQVLLFGSHEIVGVARCVVMEATRMRVGVLFVLGLFIFLPLLGYSVGSEPRLTYRVQSFLYGSMLVSGLMLCLMSVFVSCQTVCDDLYDKQIFLTLSKPVSRFDYLFGKWVGLCLLNGLLVLIACGGTYVMVGSLVGPARETAVDYDDYLNVTRKILTARVEVVPYKKDQDRASFDKELRIRGNQLAEQEYGKGSVADAEILSRISAMMANEMLIVKASDFRDFYFHDVSDADSEGEFLELNLKPLDSLGRDEVRLGVEVNGEVVGASRLYKTDIVQSVMIPVSLVGADGDLRVRIHNFSKKIDGDGGSIRFEPGVGLTLYRKVGDFGPNLFRGFVILWFELIFLSILGLSLGGAMSFPVACLCGLFVLCVAFTSNYLIGILGISNGLRVGEFWGYAMKHFGEGHWWDGFVRLTQILGGLVVFVMPQFGKYDAVEGLSRGHLVSGGDVLEAGVMMVLVWSLLVGFCGWLIFRSRELARIVY